MHLKVQLSQPYKCISHDVCYARLSRGIRTAGLYRVSATPHMLWGIGCRWRSRYYQLIHIHYPYEWYDECGSSSPIAKYRLLIYICIMLLCSDSDQHHRQANVNIMTSWHGHVSALLAFCEPLWSCLLWANTPVDSHQKGQRRTLSCFLWW